MAVSRRIERILTRRKRNHERIDKTRRERLFLPFAQFVMLMPYMTAETVRQLELIEPPTRIGKADVPKDLQLVTFGTLTRLQQAAQPADYARTCCRLVSILTGESVERTMSRRACDVLGVVNMVRREMERIGKLFQTLNGEKSSNEVAAGIDRLNFGAFGIVDWYAKRMGIVDHEEVFDTPWARIYQCMKIDYEQGEFEKRYRKIIERSAKK